MGFLWWNSWAAFYAHRIKRIDFLVNLTYVLDFSLVFKTLKFITRISIQIDLFLWMIVKRATLTVLSLFALKCKGRNRLRLIAYLLCRQKPALFVSGKSWWNFLFNLKVPKWILICLAFIYVTEAWHLENSISLLKISLFQCYCWIFYKRLNFVLNCRNRSLSLFIDTNIGNILAKLRSRIVSRTEVVTFLVLIQWFLWWEVLGICIEDKTFLRDLRSEDERLFVFW